MAADAMAAAANSWPMRATCSGSGPVLRPADRSDAIDPVDWDEAMDPVDCDDAIEPMDNSDPMEPMESREPADPIERSEPAEPMESKEPADPIDKREPADPMESRDPTEPIEDIDEAWRPCRSADPARFPVAPSSELGRPVLSERQMLFSRNGNPVGVSRADRGWRNR